MRIVNNFTSNARQWDKFRLEFRLLGFTFIELRLSIVIYDIILYNYAYENN